MKSSYRFVLPFLLFTACQTNPKPPPPLVGDLVGVVYDLDRVPVNGAKICLSNQDQHYEATTDTQGRFTILNITEGSYSLSFSKGMYEKRNWNVDISDFSEALYLQTAGYWQLLDAALDALGRKEWQEASEYLMRGESIQAESTTSLFLQAVLHEKRDNIPAAIEDVKAAIVIDDHSPHLWLYLADLYERSKADCALSIEALTRYLELRDDPLAVERLSKLQL